MINIKNALSRSGYYFATVDVKIRENNMSLYKFKLVGVMTSENDKGFASLIDENGEVINPMYVANNIINIAKNIKAESIHTSIYIQTILPVNLDMYELVKNIKLKRKDVLEIYVMVLMYVGLT